MCVNTHPFSVLYLYIHLPFISVLRIFFLAQMGSTALLLAALSGSVEVVRMLIDEYGKSLDEVNNVSVYPTKCGPLYLAATLKVYLRLPGTYLVYLVLSTNR